MRLPHDGLDAVDRAALLTGLDDGLSVLQAGGADARSALLTSNVLVALAAPAGALLWACVVVSGLTSMSLVPRLTGL